MTVRRERTSRCLLNVWSQINGKSKGASRGQGEAHEREVSGIGLDTSVSKPPPPEKLRKNYFCFMTCVSSGLKARGLDSTIYWGPFTLEGLQTWPWLLALSLPLPNRHLAGTTASETYLLTPRMEVSGHTCLTMCENALFFSSDGGLERQGWLDADGFLSNPRGLQSCGTAAIWGGGGGCHCSFLCHSGAVGVQLLPDEMEQAGVTAGKGRTGWLLATFGIRPNPPSQRRSKDFWGRWNRPHVGKNYWTAWPINTSFSPALPEPIQKLAMPAPRSLPVKLPPDFKT